MEPSVGWRLLPRLGLVITAQAESSGEDLLPAVETNPSSVALALRLATSTPETEMVEQVAEPVKSGLGSGPQSQSQSHDAWTWVSIGLR